jgi:diaminopimelate epimerase
MNRNVPLKFTKMHGLGNDFMVIDGISQDVDPQSMDIKAWSNRHCGIGFDQLLLVEAPDQPDVEFRYRIFNADGGEVEHCGNGARCFARFVTDKGLTHSKVIRVAVAKGVIALSLQADGQVTVDMGAPKTDPAAIPFITDQAATSYAVTVAGASEPVQLSVVSMGNPHAVILVDDVNKAPVVKLGAAVQALAAFPEQCNVGFMQILSRNEIRLRVFERGVGETLACGTGACAAVVAGQRLGLLDNAVTVGLLGGALQIHWQDGGAVIMTGPVTTVYEGQIAWN